MANGAAYGTRGSFKEALKSKQLVRLYSIKRKPYIIDFQWVYLPVWRLVNLLHMKQLLQKSRWVLTVCSKAAIQFENSLQKTERGKRWTIGTVAVPVQSIAKSASTLMTAFLFPGPAAKGLVRGFYAFTPLLRQKQIEVINMTIQILYNTSSLQNDHIHITTPRTPSISVAARQKQLLIMMRINFFTPLIYRQLFLYTCPARHIAICRQQQVIELIYSFTTAAT